MLIYMSTYLEILAWCNTTLNDFLKMKGIKILTILNNSMYNNPIPYNHKYSEIKNCYLLFHN